MANNLLVLALVIGCSVQAHASKGFTTFASTYNAHTINHAVAYPVSSPKVTVPAVAATPTIITDTIPNAFGPIPVAAPTAATSTTASASQPASTQAPAANQPPAIFTTAVQRPFEGAPFIFFAPNKVGFPTTQQIPFTGGANGVVYANGPVFNPSYGAAPTYAAAFGPYAAGPAFSSAPASPVGPNYLPGSVAFAPGDSVAFASGPAASVAPGSSAWSTYLPGSVALTPGSSVAFASAPGAPASPAAFAGPSYVPW